MALTGRVDFGCEGKKILLGLPEHKFGSEQWFLFFSLSSEVIHLEISPRENYLGSMFEIYPVSDDFLPLPLLSLQSKLPSSLSQNLH